MPVALRINCHCSIALILALIMLYFYLSMYPFSSPGPVDPTRFLRISETNSKILPIVMWHGMGDTCCLPFSLGSIKKLIEHNTNSTYVKSLQIGGNVVDDYKSGFFIHPNKQIKDVCKQLESDPMLKNGYNALGFSQGGQFLRAVAQRCPNPPMKTLITFGAQHQGIFGLPECPSLKQKTCEYLRKLLNYAAYEKFVQNDLVQATYWHDPLHEEIYQRKSTFLSDINNELDKTVNQKYIQNLNKLKKFVMVMFANDTIVQPKESQWFSYYLPGNDREIVSLKDSRVYKRLGLNQLDRDGKLLFLQTNGDHLHFTNEWFITNIIPHLYL